VAWKTSFTRKLLIPSLLALALGSCAMAKPKRPEWHGKLWAGDSAHAGISRSQAGEHISASDPLFDDYLAMTYADFREFFRVYVLGCKTWHPDVILVQDPERTKYVLRMMLQQIEAEEAVDANLK
jgi:hypothetical protein